MKPWIVSIPSTTQFECLDGNLGSTGLELSETERTELDEAALPKCHNLFVIVDFERPFSMRKTQFRAFGLALVLLPCRLLLGQAAAPNAELPNVLYGAAYYNEYMPADLQPGRLEKDVALMQRAGISVVRMGESTWSLWEPSDGTFDYAWMDRIVAAMGKANIKVILGTPTYSIPVWMWKAHPEMLARPLGGSAVGYGMRQNMNTDDPNYRRYAERLIVNLVEHYKKDPTVIGWQIDNETASNGASNPQVFNEFVERLKHKFGTTDALNKAWFLNYWGQDVSDWSDMPTRDNVTSTSYKLEWSRFEQDRVTDFLAWQAGLVRAHRRADQFVTQDFASAMRSDVNELEVAKVLDIVAANPYHGTQDQMDGAYQALQGDYFRSLKRQNFPRHGDERASYWLGFRGPVSAIRWPDAPGCLYGYRQWGEHGRVLALAFDSRWPGNILEGRARPRPRAQPRLCRGQSNRA